jgi:hypothetical protein
MSMLEAPACLKVGMLTPDRAASGRRRRGVTAMAIFRGGGLRVSTQRGL